LPARRSAAETLPIPDWAAFDIMLKGTGDREISTTLAFVRLLTVLTRNKEIGPRIVPIVPDEARTFGMEGLFRQLGIYSSVGQLYTPQDVEQLAYYKEDKRGQILEEGINEAGAFCSWLAAATAYSNHGVSMIPFYIFYSMFGFQRIGDLAWASGDSRARGFLLGGTAGRTTLAGEGLQHQDGHSHLIAATNPNCVAYDPCYAYELAVIIHHGMKRMYQDHHDVYYYITVMNEAYTHPPMPEGVNDGIVKGMYRLRQAEGNGERVQLLGSGAILREVEAASDLLAADYGIAADVWSVTSFTELCRDGIDKERWNLLHPDDQPKRGYAELCLTDTLGPVIAATDYMRNFAEQIRPYVPRRYVTLGTDGYGRSDTREALRQFFEVNRHYIVVATLKALADEGRIDRAKIGEAIRRYGINPEKPAPWTV
jgi:pyruvate dehydrogenase E1 component